jgi:predicted lipoprotein with Yx(FWY)xxD motif
VRRVSLVAVGLAVILSATACTSKVDPSTAAAPASQLPAASIDALLVLRAQNSPQLGQVVVDGNGYVLYRFDKDTARPPKSNCLEDCWMKWPPVMDSGDIRLDGIDQALVGNVVRPDSTRQVTIGGWPVYRYAGDTTPGEARGQGTGNVWFAITPQGRKSTAAPANAAGGNPGGGTNAGTGGGGTGGGVPSPAPAAGSGDGNY